MIREDRTLTDRPLGTQATGTVIDPNAPIKDGRAERKPFSEEGQDQDKKLPVNVFSTIDVVPDSESPAIFRATVYRGIGNLRKTTPQGEVNARPGDVILEAPGGLYIIDQLTAMALFGHSLDDILYTDPVKSQREIEDLSSSTHPETVRESERARQEQLKKDEDITVRRQRAREAAEAARTQNIGGEIKLESQQTHLRNVGGEVRVMPGPHPAEMNPDLGLLTDEEKKQLEIDNQSDRTGAASRQPVSGTSSPEEGVTRVPGISGMLSQDEKDRLTDDQARMARLGGVRRTEDQVASGENQALPQKTQAPLNPFEKARIEQERREAEEDSRKGTQ